MAFLKQYQRIWFSALLVLIGVITYYNVFRTQPGAKFNVVGQKLPMLSKSSLEKLPDDFRATWLLLGHSAVVTSAKKLSADPQFISRYQVQFESEDPYSFLRDQYVTYFTKSGWTLEQPMMDASLSAKRGREQARVDFAPRGSDGLTVTIWYSIVAMQPEPRR